MDAILFVQINLHHCGDANDAVAEYVIRNGVDVILCQDPYVFEDSIRGFPSDWPVFHSINNNSAIIFTNNDYAVIKSLALDNSVTVTINVFNSKLLICSQYSSPSGDLEKDFLDLNNSYSDYDDMIIAGDFNVPLINLGYTRQTDRSETLMEFLTDRDLTIINDQDAPHTFVQGSLRGKPDLTLAGINVVEKVMNWSVDDKTFSFSDHLYIRFTLSYTPERKLNIRYKTKNKSFKKFNMKAKEMEHGLLEDLLLVRTADDLDKHVNKLTFLMTDLADDSFRKGNLSHKPTIRWYTQELKTQRNRVAASYKRYKNSPENDTYHEVYKNLRNDYNKKVRAAKRESWISYCQKTDNAFGNLYKYVAGKSLHYNDLIFTRLEGSSVFDTYNDTADSLMREHFNIHERPSHIHNYRSSYSLDHTGYQAESVTNREIKYAISMQNKNKAPGFGRFDALIVKNFCRTNINYIRNLFTICFQLGHFPDVWLVE